MDPRSWLELGIFIFGQLVLGAGIIYSRGKHDAGSIGRFKANEARIIILEKLSKEQELELKAIRISLYEGSILMARIDERTASMTKTTERIENKLELMSNTK